MLTMLLFPEFFDQRMEGGQFFSIFPSLLHFFVASRNAFKNSLLPAFRIIGRNRFFDRHPFYLLKDLAETGYNVRILASYLRIFPKIVKGERRGNRACSNCLGRAASYLRIFQRYELRTKFEAIRNAGSQPPAPEIFGETGSKAEPVFCYICANRPPGGDDLSDFCGRFRPPTGKKSEPASAGL